MYTTLTTLDACWLMCVKNHGLRLQLRPVDDLHLIVTRLRRRLTALKKSDLPAATRQALGLYRVVVDAERRQLHLTYADVVQDSLRYIVRQLELVGLPTGGGGKDILADLGLLDVTFPPADYGVKVVPINLDKPLK